MIDTAYFKQKLEEEKALLLKELASVGAPNPRNPEDWDAKESAEEATERADLNTAADIHEETEERHAVTDTLEERLQEVNDALERMVRGKYGICEIGNEEIERERLRANPAARTCTKHLNE
ncbi:MAG: hypothetical protein HYS74_01010 [Parcubacteria group bacterium]|nr:hypothetical protein [Parcubacteria group bacterium]